MPKFLIVIAGPTAAGKTELAIRIAKNFKTEILSADSRQFYKELNIGVSRPSEVQFREVKHHFIACRSVTEDYAAGIFAHDALKTLDKIYAKRDVAVMAGGSGLYISAVCSGFDDIPPVDPEIRRQLQTELEGMGLKYMQLRLEQLDPTYYLQANLSNPRRVLRALEVSLSTGKPYSSFFTEKKQPRDFTPVKIGLTLERKLLYEKINLRVDDMMESGLLDEVKSLVKFRECNALLTVGYKELFDHLDGKIDLNTAVNLIKKNTRNYAKRQLTWFRKDSEIKWFEPGQEEEIMKFINSKMKD